MRWIEQVRFWPASAPKRTSMKFRPLARDEDPGSLFCIRDLVGRLHPNAPPPRKAGTNPRIATMAAHNSLQHITEFKAGRRMSMAGAPVQDATDWSCAMSAVASARDRDSFMRIYDHFMPRLCVYLRGLGTPPAVAEELAQESLLRLWQNAASYDPRRSAVSTWLFRIARNLFIDRARRLRYQAAQEETLRLFEVVPEPNTVEGHADTAVLERRIQALSPVQARLIRMSYFEARSHQEIADELGMPLGTVKSHLRRAFQRLQGELGVES